MISLTFAAPLIMALNTGSAQFTFDGVTTTHEVTECSMEPDASMPARLLIDEMNFTLNVVHADHMQTIAVIRDNASWSASRLKSGETWRSMKAGEPDGPIIHEWDEEIHVEAVLSSGQAGGEKTVTLTARCR